MRIKFIVGCLILGLAGQVVAVPRAVVDEPDFNFGPQHNNQSIDHTFVVRNEGDRTLEITNIRSSCGCTVGNITARSIEPGETSEITASYNLRGRQGRQRSTLTLETNDPNQRSLRLTMSGEAIRELQVRPQNVIFGQLMAGQKAEREVEIIGMASQPFEIQQASVSTAGVEVERIEELTPYHYRIGLSVTMEGRPGHHQGSLQLQTSHSSFPLLTIPVTAELVGALAVAPEAITLMGDNANAVTRYVVVRPGAINEFEILEVIPPDEDISVNIFSLPRGAYRIQLTNLRAHAGLAEATLLIRTSATGMEEIELPFRIVGSDS